MSYIARGTYPAGNSALTFDDGLVRRHERLCPAELELRNRVQAVIYTYEIGLVQPTNRSPGAA
ncbi:hypothetical protein AB0G20_24715 [Streptomyces sp. NPDC024017]|uniref:hypothetical protein n=1 Tax=Streptomyces sp. NPDC024017 TaxID=3154326 RepID=UPI0033D77B35